MDTMDCPICDDDALFDDCPVCLGTGVIVLWY